MVKSDKPLELPALCGPEDTENRPRSQSSRLWKMFHVKHINTSISDNIIPDIAQQFGRKIQMLQLLHRNIEVTASLL
jgi:hypothetical protein